jgi:hypothetical protein
MGRLVIPSTFTDKLVAFWNLDNPNSLSTIPADYGSFTLNSHVGYSSVNGKINNAFKFDFIEGENSQGLWTNEQIWNLLTSPTSFSVSFWIKKLQNIDASLLGNAFGSMGFNFDYIYDSAYWAPNVGFAFRITKGLYEWNSAWTQENNISINEWYHLVGTYDHPSATMKLYVNNILKSTVTNVSIGENSEPGWHGFAVNGTVIDGGKVYGGDATFDGLGFWNKTLNQNEISILYNNGNGKQYTDNKISIKKQNLGGGKLRTYKNLILNSKFDADNQYPIYDGTLFFDNNYNPGGDCANEETCTILTNYRHNSPLLYSPYEFDYHTFANRTFHEINSPYNILPIGHTIQPRLLKMFGAGSKFGRSDNNTNYLKTITNTTSFFPSSAQSWTKYGFEQMVKIPSWATKVVYGVKYLAKSDDLFRENNFAGLKLNFRLSNFIVPYRNYVNIHLIRRSTASAVDTLESLYGSNVYLYFDADSSSNAMCQWLGPNVTKVKVRKRSSNIIDSNTDSFIKIEDTIDIPTFSSSSAEPDFGNGRPEFVSLEMFFAEWVSYLNDDTISSGSIYFYEPFIYFV